MMMLLILLGCLLYFVLFDIFYKVEKIWTYVKLCNGMHFRARHDRGGQAPRFFRLKPRLQSMTQSHRLISTE